MDKKQQFCRWATFKTCILYTFYLYSTQAAHTSHVHLYTVYLQQRVLRGTLKATTVQSYNVTNTAITMMMMMMMTSI